MTGFLVGCWPRISTSRIWEIAALVVVLALSVVHQALFATVAEDAYITFRYSVSLADGNGPVFNVGERVEGYSNFLWMVLLAIPRSVADVDIVLFARALGVVCALGSLVVLHVLVRRVTGSAPGGVLATLLAAAAGSVAAYGPSGLETPLFTLLVLAVVLAVVAERPVLAGFLVALATMTRPDGVVIAAVVGLWLIFQTRGWRFPVLFAAAALALTIPWTAWRYAYYGHLLPNALAAKSGLDLSWQLQSGWDYLLGFLATAQALLVLAPLAAYALMSPRIEMEARTSGAGGLLLAIAVSYVGFFVLTGGDWMPAWRFFAPAVPLVVAGVAVTLSAMRSPIGFCTRGAAVFGATASALLLAASVSNANMVDRVAMWRQQVVELSEIGAWLNRTLPAGTTVSTFANGALSFHAGPNIVVVDQLGLTDEHIAREGRRDPKGLVGHAAHDYEYVVDVRKPAVVFTSGGGFARAPSCVVPPYLGQHYVGRAFQFDDRQLWAVAYLRAEQADALTAQLDGDPRFRHVPCP